MTHKNANLKFNQSEESIRRSKYVYPETTRFGVPLISHPNYVCEKHGEGQEDLTITFPKKDGEDEAEVRILCLRCILEFLTPIIGEMKIKEEINND